MPHIIISEEQAKIIAESQGQVEVRDENGKHLGYLVQTFTDEEIAIAQKRCTSEEARFTTSEVLEHLESLNQQ